MTAAAIFSSMLRYQAWAHDAFLRALEDIDDPGQAEARHAALRVLNHCLVVNLIFKGHLTGVPHGFAANNTPDTPTPQTLRTALAALDGWYLEFVATVPDSQLAESIAFTFTDGDKGCMTRQEMLLHVVTHGTYHRGEVGRILKQIQVAPPWDTFAVHLHQDDPVRRLHRPSAPA
ncbi:DinB family protein [Paracidovorax anthurii]|uniref:Putative damage-inducible protein DinB n=1 Tax=Paracidovorax anthurii TaxID=78229 RepID=A0A328Z4L4_9BURK|nr:DinB family protein [Paracidovorax anthurii]RAR80998.1 putative damage-inducible protein DinB [Paracidovorax anthurii]